MIRRRAALKMLGAVPGVLVSRPVFAAATPAATPKARVTLVRWPYT